MSITTSAGAEAAQERASVDTRLMLRAAQLYYHGELTQDAVGKRLGVSRFKVGRLLDRALRERAVRIEIVHPAARLVALEDALVERFGLADAVVVDVPAADDEQVARERVAQAAADHLAALAPTGVIGVSWGRTMLELANRIEPGWTHASQIVQLNGAISRSARPTRYQEVVERFGSTSGAGIQLMPAPAIVGTAELRQALEADPAVATPLRLARRARSAVFGMGVMGPASVHVASGYLDARDLRRLQRAGAVGDVLGRFITAQGEIALPALDARTVGLPLAQLSRKRTVGLAAGPGRGPVALGALRGGFLRTLVTDEATASWVLDHG
jgi:deoxyribonucleoside regulator